MSVFILYISNDPPMETFTTAKVFLDTEGSGGTTLGQCKKHILLLKNFLTFFSLFLTIGGQE